MKRHYGSSRNGVSCGLSRLKGNVDVEHVTRKTRGPIERPSPMFRDVVRRVYLIWGSYSTKFSAALLLLQCPQPQQIRKFNLHISTIF